MSVILNKSPMKSLVLVISVALEGCAIEYLDKEGNRRVIGLASVTISEELSCAAPSQVEVTTIGFSYVDLPSHGALGIGYSRNTSISVSENSIVISGRNEGDD